MKRFLDPDFRYHATLGKLLTLVLLTLADSILLPFNIKEYGRRVNEEADAVLRRKNEIKSVQDYNFGQYFNGIFFLLSFKTVYQFLIYSLILDYYLYSPLPQRNLGKLSRDPLLIERHRNASRDVRGQNCIYSKMVELLVDM